jgi:hypothetical protein
MVSALVLLGGCQRQDQDGPLAVSGRIFVFNYRVAIASYLVTLSRNGDVPAGSVVETTFENPQGGEPFVTRQTVFPNQPKLVLESPPLHCVAKDRPYRVTIRLLGKTGAPLQTLETTVTSSDDQSIMPAKPLVLGPLYSPNPDVFKADGTVDVSSESGCLP